MSKWFILVWGLRVVAESRPGGKKAGSVLVRVLCGARNTQERLR
jgi:hypothetical protein